MSDEDDICPLCGAPWEEHRWVVYDGYAVLSLLGEVACPENADDGLQDSRLEAAEAGPIDRLWDEDREADTLAPPRLRRRPRRGSYQPRLHPTSRPGRRAPLHVRPSPRGACP